VYKELFDKAMEVRKIIDLDITVTNGKTEDEMKKKKIEPDVAMVYM